MTPGVPPTSLASFKSKEGDALSRSCVTSHHDREGSQDAGRNPGLSTDFLNAENVPSFLASSPSGQIQVESSERLWCLASITEHLSGGALSGFYWKLIEKGAVLTGAGIGLALVTGRFHKILLIRCFHPREFASH